MRNENTNYIKNVDDAFECMTDADSQIDNFDGDINDRTALRDHVEGHLFAQNDVGIDYIDLNKADRETLIEQLIDYIIERNSDD